jgi:hypothetical protein
LRNVSAVALPFRQSHRLAKPRHTAARSI